MALLTATGVLETAIPEPRSLAIDAYQQAWENTFLCASLDIDVIVACPVVADVFEGLGKDGEQLCVEGAGELPKH